MNTVERIGRHTLMLGDCRELMPKADAVLSDPPYGIAYAAMSMTKAANTRGSPAIIGDTEPFDPSPWLTYPQALLWGADHFFPRLPDSGRWLAWNKLAALESWDTFSDVEFAWHSAEGAARIFSMLWKGLACDKRGEEHGLREHPMQKPVRLMRWCLGATRAATRLGHPRSLHGQRHNRSGLRATRIRVCRLRN